MGVYTWIRESVRQAVLLGFSDAVEQLGMPTEGQEINPKLAGLLRGGVPALAHLPAGQAARPAGSRKRLGKSLEQLRHEAGEA